MSHSLIILTVFVLDGWRKTTRRYSLPCSLVHKRLIGYFKLNAFWWDFLMYRSSMDGCNQNLRVVFFAERKSDWKTRVIGTTAKQSHQSITFQPELTKMLTFSSDRKRQIKEKRRRLLRFRTRACVDVYRRETVSSSSALFCRLFID